MDRLRSWRRLCASRGSRSARVLALGSALCASFGCDRGSTPAPAHVPAHQASDQPRQPLHALAAAKRRPDGLLAVGEAAPEVSVRDQQGRERTLREFRGKQVVVYFYPRDATPGCTVEARAFRDHYSEFVRAGAVVLGVSTDDPKSHASFAAEEKLPFTLLADTDEQLAKAFGVRVRAGFASRVSFVLNAHGRVSHVFPRVSPKEHAQEVLAALGAQAH